MRTAVVMPVGPNRHENVTAVVRSLARQTYPVDMVVLVCDGLTGSDGFTSKELQFVLESPRGDMRLHLLDIPKHEPGMEQPRNIGVRWLARGTAMLSPEDAYDYVWFVDSDVTLDERAHEAYHHAHDGPLEPSAWTARERILVGPYEWLPPGQRQPDKGLYNDPRWVSFREHGPLDVLRDDVGAGLACFSGNLMWPIKEFVRVGGFWSELHHGRCEDGELGLRATALGVPISFVGEARGWHLYHDIDVATAQARNARDVPMIDARHPWVHDRGLEVVPEDGRRFNVRCKECGQSINTLEWWHHTETCGGRL